MEIPSLLRVAEHEALSRIELKGKVLDLGGDNRSVYLSLFKGEFTCTTVNLDRAAQPDVFHDLEKPLPLESHSYDAVLLINVLEHIYNYKELLSEAARVLKPGGKAVIVVPFLFPEHPSPKDFHRFTRETLKRLCEAAGLHDVHIQTLGRGVFSAQHLLIDRLLPKPLRFVNYYVVRFFVLLGDHLFAKTARVLSKGYNPAHYALGYCVVAKKDAQH